MCTHKVSYNFADIRPLSHKIAFGCTEVEFSQWITYTFNSDDSENRIYTDCSLETLILPGHVTVYCKNLL